MKANLVPVYFSQSNKEEFELQLARLQDILINEADFLSPIKLGDDIPKKADAVIFPVLIGEAYRKVKQFKNIHVPIIATTSEFGTVAMWDWEIITYLKSEGINVLCPYNVELTKVICRALSLKTDLKNTKFLVYQDNPGDGMQAEIFKRFYWWEQECTDLIEKRFGVKIIKKSFKKLGEEAKQIPDQDAEEVINKWKLNDIDISNRAYLSAIKLYIAVKKDLAKDETIKGVGINCLNESFHSDTTPCLAWSLLYEEKGILWACEADTMSLLTMYLINKSLRADIIMSNLYPFLVGMAALKHEKIDAFPDVPQPENCILVAHCGFVGVIPKCMTADWSLKPKVLAIVDDNAHAIDARLPVGPLTLAKLHPKLSTLQIIEANLDGYAQYPGSDCRNGAVVRVKDGYKLMDRLYSHHYTIVTGDRRTEMKFMCAIFGLDQDVM